MDRMRSRYRSYISFISRGLYGHPKHIVIIQSRKRNKEKEIFAIKFIIHSSECLLRNICPNSNRMAIRIRVCDEIEKRLWAGYMLYIGMPNMAKGRKVDNRFLHLTPMTNKT